MSFAAGSYHGLSFIEETTFGTTPAGTPTGLRHTSCGLGISKDGFQSNELRSDRMISDFRHGVIRAQGDIGFEFSYSEFDSILEGALFGVWSENVLKAGTTAKFYTLRRRFADILIDGVFTGCMFNGFSLSIPANAMVTGSFNVIGKEGSYVGTQHTATLTITAAVGAEAGGDVTTTIAGGTPVTTTLANADSTTEVATKIAASINANALYTATSDAAVVTIGFNAVDGVATVVYDPSTTEAAGTVSGIAPTTTTASQTHAPFDSFTGVLKEGGSTIAVITSIDFNLQNGLEPTFVVGANTTPQIVPGRSNLTGSISAHFETKALLDKFINETESSIELELGSTSNKYDFHIPRIKYTGGDNPASGGGPLVLNMPFQALYDTTEATNLKITRTPDE